jgi:prepilin-type processing-associated H-X9-DG protein
MTKEQEKYAEDYMQVLFADGSVFFIDGSKATRLRLVEMLIDYMRDEQSTELSMDVARIIVWCFLENNECVWVEGKGYVKDGAK